MIRALALLLALPLAAPAQEAPLSAPPASPLPTVLTVSGEGTVATVPDIAVIGVSISREAPTARAAMDAMSAASQAVVARLREAGVEDRDLQTGQLSLGPRWDHSRDGPSEIVGYVASTTLTVRARDLDGLGATLDAAVGDGANGISGPDFRMADPGPAEDEARRAAMRDALSKAALYAGEAGLEVARIRSVTEGARHGPPMPGPMMMEARMASDVAIERGEVETREVVQVVVELAAPEGGGPDAGSASNGSGE